jgi:ABC-2 type transport system ATP-binding protein
MDEAEYCSRVGIMRDGRLLAIDTPLALKESVLAGTAWDIYPESLDGTSEPTGQTLLSCLDILQSSEFVLRAGLVSDRLRAITPPDLSAEGFLSQLEQAGLVGIHLQKVEATLEDVFLALAARD